MAGVLSGRATNVMIAHENFADDAVLTSPTTFAAGLPLENMLDDQLTLVARSASNSMVLDLDFGQAVPVTLAMVLGHNLTETARWRIRAASARSGSASAPGGYTFAAADTVYDSRQALRSGTALGTLAWSGNQVLDHDFTTGTLPAGATFTRASVGTYFDYTGTLRTAGSGDARFDYDPVTKVARGILIEGARTNLLVNAESLLTQSVTVTAQAYTLSFYGTGTVSLSGASTAGPLVGSAAFPTRSTLTFTPSAGTLNLTVTGTVQYAQLEAGAFPTSYIPTAASAVTRAADVPAMPTSALPSFNAAAGTLLTKLNTSTQSTGRQTLVGVYDGSGNKAEISRNAVSVSRASAGVSYSWTEGAGETATATIATTFNTGWQPGDIRGAWLCDSATGNVAASGELLTNGDFSAGATGWTLGTGWAVTGGAAIKTAGTASTLRTSLTPTVGQTYLVSLTVAGRTAGLLQMYAGGGQVGANLTANGTVVAQFTAVSTGGNVLDIYADASFDGTIDNVSVRLALPDRSYKAKGLTVNGTLTRTALPCGLAAVSGFSASNYLWQPYSPDLDFGTGDWSYDFWLYNGTATPSFDRIFDRGLLGLSSGAHIRALVSAGQLILFISDGTNTATATTSALTWGSGIWRHVVFSRRSGALEIWVDGALMATQTAGSVGSLNCVGAELRIGAALSGVAAWGGGMVMAKTSAYALTPTQIRRMYTDEHALFVGGQPALLGGVSNTVTGLTRAANGDVLVVTSSGQTTMYGLARQSYVAGSGSSNSTQAVSGFEEFLFEIGSPSATTALTTRDQTVPGSETTVAAAFGAGGASLAAGGNATASASVAVPTWGTTTMRIGSNSTGANSANAAFEQLTYVASRVSNADIQALTNPATTPAQRAAILAPYSGSETAQPITLGLGSKTVRAQDTDMRLYAGARVRLRIDTSRYMEGTVTAYDRPSRVLTLNITAVEGSGSATSMALERADEDITVWPDVTPFGSGGYWGQFTWGGLVSLLGQNYLPPGIHMPAIASGLGDPVYGRYFKIEITDPGRTYLDIGRLVISPAYQPTINLQYGWEMQFVDPSPRTRSRGGQYYVDARRKYRRLTISLQGIKKDEMWPQLYELDRQLGVAKPFTIIVFPADPVHLHRMTIYGSQPETSGISNPTQNGYSKSITIEEWV